MKSIIRTGVAVLAALALVFSFTAPAIAADRQWSGAKDFTVTTDMPGWAKVRVKYEDRGHFGNRVFRVCVKAKQHLTTSAKVDLYFGDRWSADTFRFTFSRFHNLADGTWTCKRTSDYRRTLAVDDNWRWRGTFSGPLCVGSWCPFEGYGAASGRM